MLKLSRQIPCAAVLLAGILAPLAGRAQSQPAPAPQSDAVTVRDGIVYGSAAGATLTADLYLPAGSGPFPAIVFIHGGAWHDGTRKQLRGQAQLMAENGFVGLAIDYRLSPANHFPAALDDAKSAVRFLRAHAAEFHIDPDRIAAVGSSAGAHLAALLGVESTPLAASQHRSATDASVQAVVAFNGIFDLATMPLSQKTADFLGAPCASVAALCKDASPQQHVHPGMSLPPFLLLHGTADQTAPYTQAVAFQKALDSAADHVELFTAPGAPHTFWSEARWRDPSFNAMRDFLLHSMR